MVHEGLNRQARSTVRGARWLCVGLLCQLALACGGSDGATPSTVPGDDASADLAGFCRMWSAVNAEDDQPLSAASFEESLLQLESLASFTPRSLRSEVEALRDAVSEFDQIAGAYDYDGARFLAEASEAERTKVDEVSIVLAELPSTTRTAAFAFDSCDGAKDPVFVLPCTAQSFEAVGSAIGGGTTAETSPPPGQPAEQLIEEEQDRTPGAVGSKQRDAESGGIEIAFLDAAGRPVKLVELTPAGAGYSITKDTTCLPVAP